MSDNPYQPLDDIWDLLLALVPDVDAAMALAERAGLYADRFDRTLPLDQILRDIISAAHWQRKVSDLMTATVVLYPAHEQDVVRAYQSYEANTPPGFLAGPATADVDADELIDLGTGDDRELIGADATDEDFLNDLIGAGEELAVDAGENLAEDEIIPVTGGGGEIDTLPPPIPANGGPTQERVETLRLDTAVPQAVTVGEAFQLAVAVRQTDSPLLGRDNLPVVDSGDVQVLWPAGAVYITLRTQISAPDCVIEGPKGDTFKLFAGRDSPVFLYHLTPEHAGAISIYVTVYQEQDRLGTAGVITEARVRHRRPSQSRVAGEMEVTVSSLALAPQGSLAALEPLHDLFVDLFGRDRDAPRILAEQAGLDVSLIPFSNINSDYLWNLLVEAHQRNAVAALVEQAIERKTEREDDLRAALAQYEQLAIRGS